MKSRHIAALILFALSSGTRVHAAPATDPDALVFDCSSMQLPDQRAVSHVLRIDNLTQAYAARTRVMQMAQRACLRGVGIVRIVRDESAQPIGTSLADAAD